MKRFSRTTPIGSLSKFFSFATLVGLLRSLNFFSSPLREPVYSYNSFIFLYKNTLHKLRYCVLIRVPLLTFRQDKYLVTMIVWKERMK